MNAVIIDDEVKSATNLQLMLKQVAPDVQVVALAYTALDGVKAIRQHAPDVIFLDIQMPSNSGFDVLDHLGELNPDVVFVTAHEEYAIRALRSKAFDYLLKPLDMDELRLCVERLNRKRNTARSAASFAAEATENSGQRQLSVPVKEGILFLKQNDIIRIEAAGSYTYVFMTGGAKHLVSKNMKVLEEQLDNEIFFRCHNSHIINLQRISKYIKTDGHFAEMEDGSHVEIARTRKPEFLERFGIQ